MSGGVLLQAVLSGLASGAVVGLVAIGFTLVWSLTRVLALDHGDLVVGAALLAVLVVVGRTPIAVPPDAARSLALVGVTLAAGVALSVLSYTVAVRPFLDGAGRSADVLGWVAGTVTLGLVLRTGIAVALPAPAYAVPDPLHLDKLTASGVLALPGGGILPVRALPVLGIALALAAGTDIFVRRSAVGRGMRAVAEDLDAAQLCGVPVRRSVLVAFALAGALAAVAGLLDTPGRSVAIDSGVTLGLAGAAAALLGGLGSARGAVVGGLAIGVAQQLVGAEPHLGAAWSPLVPLAVLVVVLAVRPEGRGLQRRVAVE